MSGLPERTGGYRRRRAPRFAFDICDYFDSRALMANIGALYAGASIDGVPPFDIVTLFRDALVAARAKVREELENGGDGMRCARHLSMVQDELIRVLFQFVITHVHPSPDLGRHRLVVAAVGGYGRGTLAPGSDIDLLFLLPAKEDRWALRVTEAMLYTLWDLRLKVGHSTRSVEDCLSYAREDMTIRTALLEARFILGDPELFADMRRRFDAEIVSGTPAEFVAAKLAERDNRVSRAGRSRYLVEPNVKDSKGGLRDLNTLFWIAKYVYRVHNSSELVQAGLFSRKEYRLFCRCEEFLWRVRCHLHF